MQLKKTIELYKEKINDFILLQNDIKTIIKIDSTNYFKCLDTQTEDFYYECNTEYNIYTILNMYDGVSFLIGQEQGHIEQYKYSIQNDLRIYIKTKDYFHYELINNSDTLIIYAFKICNLFLLYNNTFASVSEDGSITVYIADNKVYINNPINKPTNIVKCINEHKSLIYYINNTIILYDLKSKQIVTQINKKYNISSFEVLNDDYYVLSYKGISKAEKDIKSNAIYIYNLKDESFVKEIEVSSNNIFFIKNINFDNSILVYNGSAVKGFNFDLINIKF